MPESTVDVYLQIPEDVDPELDLVFEFLEDAQLMGYEADRLINAMETAIEMTNAAYYKQVAN